MQYSPKLKAAMDDIKDVLKRYDIAGFVVIHTPGFYEYLNYLTPSYSCAKLENGEFRVRLKEAELPGGSKQAEQMAADTFNMVTLLTDTIAQHAAGYMEFQSMLQEHWNGSHGDSTHTSHDQQNN
jgi:hypothetical protein